MILRAVRNLSGDMKIMAGNNLVDSFNFFHEKFFNLIGLQICPSYKKTRHSIKLSWHNL